MSKVCEICGKSKFVGGTIVRRGLAKKKGGIGMHVVKNNTKVFNINLQTVRVKQGSTVKTMKVCTRCIKSEKVQKA